MQCSLLTDWQINLFLYALNQITTHILYPIRTEFRTRMDKGVFRWQVSFRSCKHIIRLLGAGGQSRAGKFCYRSRTEVRRVLQSFYQG